MTNTGNFPVPQYGRNHDDTNWVDLAIAHDTWHDCLEYAERYGVSEVDVDLFDYVMSVFAAHDLWDYQEGQPLFKDYYELIKTRC